MATALPVYSAREVQVSWGFTFDGFSGDNIVSLAYNTDLTMETVSADGKLATSVTPDRTGTVTVELMATSETNQALSAILAAQNNGLDTADIFKADFTISDPSGSVIALARQAYLKTAPEIGIGVEVGTFEWVFYSEKIDFLSSPSGVSQDAATLASITSIITSMNNIKDRI